MAAIYATTWQTWSPTRSRRQKRCILRSLLPPVINGTFSSVISHLSHAPSMLTARKAIGASLRASSPLGGYREK